MKKYKKFLSDKIIKESMIEPEKKPEPEKEVYIQPVVETPKPVKEENVLDTDGDNLKGIVLLLNQVLSELNELHKKIDEKEAVAPIPTMPVSEKVVESVEKGVRRKISLIRDESGKITGADVIDSVSE